MSVYTKFCNFHSRNPEVYESLVSLSREWRSYGGGKWSIWAAFNALRWEHMRAHKKDPNEVYKFSNDYFAYYSRLIMAENSDLAGIFELRPMTANPELPAIAPAVAVEDLIEAPQQSGMFAPEPAKHRSQYS